MGDMRDMRDMRAMPESQYLLRRKVTELRAHSISCSSTVRAPLEFVKRST
mgnify:FL=1